jgi:hypothetical protein
MALTQLPIRGTVSIQHDGTDKYRYGIRITCGSVAVRNQSDTYSSMQIHIAEQSAAAGGLYLTDRLY